MRIRYPEYEEITDPTPDLPGDIRAKIDAIITQTVANVRSAASTGSDWPVGRWTDVGLQLFKLLASDRLKANYVKLDALHEVLLQDAQAAMNCIHWAFKLSFGNRMGFFYWHQPILRALEDEIEAMVTEWWGRRADTNPVAPDTPPPVPTRAPRTANAALIEKFLNDVEKVTGQKIAKMDIWLTAGYHSDREFRRFQAENEPGQAIPWKFNRVLKMDPKIFIRERDAKRIEHAAYLKKKAHR